jgi:hypothetical protein
LFWMGTSRLLYGELAGNANKIRTAAREKTSRG